MLDPSNKDLWQVSAGDSSQACDENLQPNLSQNMASIGSKLSDEPAPVYWRSRSIM